MERNILSLYIIKISHWFMLVMPVMVLFYYSNGLSTQQVFILQAIYSVSIVALEIPSGYVADVLGKKKTMVVGSILGFVGYLTYSFSFGFWGFVAAEIALGIGQSMISGADSAFLYDTLAENGRKSQYVRYEGRITSLGSLAEATAGIAGGLLAGICLRMPLYFQTAVTFLAIPATLALVEPKSFLANKARSFNHVFSILRFSLVENKALRLNIIFSAVIGCATLTMAWFVQPYFKEVNVAVTLFGVLWTILNFSVGLTSLFAYRLENKLGQKNIIVLITISIPLGYLLTGIFKAQWAIVFILLFYLMRGIATPVLKNYINVLTPSEMRATVLSIRNFVIRLLFAITGPFLGWLTDKISLANTLIITGMLFFIMAITTLFYYRNLVGLGQKK